MILDIATIRNFVLFYFLFQYSCHIGTTLEGILKELRISSLSFQISHIAFAHNNPCLEYKINFQKHLNKCEAAIKYRTGSFIKTRQFEDCSYTT